MTDRFSCLLVGEAELGQQASLKEKFETLSETEETGLVCAQRSSV